MTVTAGPASVGAVHAIPGQEDEPRPAASLTSTMVRRRGAPPAPAFTPDPPPDPIPAPALAIAEDETIRPVTSALSRTQRAPGAEDEGGGARARAWADAVLFATVYVLASVAFLLAFIVF